MRRLLIIALAYAAAVFTAELTAGNAAFPLHFWYFERISAWQWSVPVHLAGFLWMLAWHRALRGAPATLPILASWVFFAAAETANLLVLGFFDYSPEPIGRAASFLAVLFLYSILCAASGLSLRKYVLKGGGR